MLSHLQLTAAGQQSSGHPQRAIHHPHRGWRYCSGREDRLKAIRPGAGRARMSVVWQLGDWNLLRWKPRPALGAHSFLPVTHLGNHTHAEAIGIFSASPLSASSRTAEWCLGAARWYRWVSWSEIAHCSTLYLWAKRRAIEGYWSSVKTCEPNI